MNNRTLPPRRTMILLTSFALILLCVGLFLRSRMNALLVSYTESQTRRQSETLATQAADRLQTELDNLAYIAARIEAHPEEIDRLMPLIYDESGVKQGLLTLEGKAIFGEDLSVKTYGGLQDSFRGNSAITFVSGQGLLFTCPVFHGSNIRYVLYRLCPPETLEERFAIRCYNDLGKLCVITRDGEMVVPFSNGSEADILFIRSDPILADFRSMYREMEVSVAVAHTFDTIRGRTVLFESEIPGTDYLIAGFVPFETASEGIGNVTFLVLWVFGMLMVLVLAGAFYLTNMQVKVRESDELREAKAAAEQASKAKSDFLARMSHEIRTPINAVMGMDELIIRETGEERIRQYALDVRRAGNTLLSLVNDVLDFSRIEAGRMSLVSENYDLALLIADLEDMIRPRMSAKGLDFYVDADPHIPRFLRGDNVRLKQCMLNLLTNAVKYTEKGEVHFILHAAPGEKGEIMLQVAVRDTGIGIREEDIRRLFTAFDRIDEKKTRAIEGTGLGLNITQQLLDMMGSRLNVESVFGSGSTFSFDVKQQVTGEEEIGDYAAAAKAAAEAENRYRRAFTAPDARLLVVDDNEMNLQVVRGLLRETRLQIDTALSGEEALGLTRKTAYDILIIDHMMPKMSGVEMLHLLREETDNPNAKAPCIVLTANAISGVREAYLREGFDDYMSKPVEGKALERLLLKYLPEEKIEDVTEPEREKENAPVRVDPAVASKIELLRGIDALHIESGIRNCGSPVSYLSMIQTFSGGIDGKLAELNGYADAEDLVGYTILVHALKSSLRIIGAEDLGMDAQGLENAGKAGDMETIRAKQQAFVDECTELGDALIDACEEEKAAPGQEAGSAELSAAYADMRRAAKEMDIDRLDEVFGRLSGYRIPEAEQARFLVVKAAYEGYDYTKILEALEEKEIST